MKHCYLFLSLILSPIMAQDDFFEPGYLIGGYGELHWNKELDENGETKKNLMDFHRFIIYYGYNWTEKWSFKSEVELEHNFVADGEGELELEQAYVNYHTDKWGFQGGVILPSAGLINEYHEPPLFLSVERPDYNKYIIPTTWFGNGFAFYGNVADYNLRIALIEDLEGEGITTSSGIRGGRGKGSKTTGYSLVKNMSAVYTGIRSLRVGCSLTLNDAPYSQVKENSKITAADVADSSLSIQIVEVNAKYNANNIYAVFEYGQNSFEGNNFTSPLKTSRGYYLDLGYNIGEMVNTNRLIPWFRVSKVSTDVDTDSKITDYIRSGLTWWPIDNVVFKMDYGTKTKKSDKDNPTTQINFGIGYNF